MASKVARAIVSDSERTLLVLMDDGAVRAFSIDLNMGAPHDDEEILMRVNPTGFWVEWHEEHGGG